MQRLVDQQYMAFPFRVDENGAITVGRADHVRQQIEQVLFTNPKERVFRPEYGAGIRMLVFEPNSSVLWQVARKRLIASLAEALQGEVDPKSLNVEVSGEGETVRVVVSYKVATVGASERNEFMVRG